MLGHLSAAADPWYTSGTLWAIVAAAATVLGTIGTWVAVVVSTPRRKLLFGIRAAAPILTAPEELRNELDIFDGGTQLTEPRFLEIEFVGRGRRDIPSGVFEGQPMQLTVGGRIVRVLTVSSNEATRRLPTVTVCDNGSTLHIGPGVIGTQIEQRCIAQWGATAHLILRDPNSAAGWKCHTPGLLP